MKYEQITPPAHSAPKPSDYLEALSNEDLTEKQKLELLEVLFNIMKAFVDLGYGLEPVNKLLAEFQKSNGHLHDLVEYQTETKDGCDG